jgi:hypothetical protein
VLQVILGLFYFLIFLEIAGTGILLPFILEESFPGKNPVLLFTSYIIYYFLIGLLIRFQMQELPSLSIQPYLTKNIKRKEMLRFLNVRSLIHVINFMPLFVFTPFTVVVLIPAFGVLAGICFLLAMFSLVINNHFLVMYLKRKTVNSMRWLLFMLLVIAGLKGLDYYHIIPLEKISTAVFLYLLEHPSFCIIPLLISCTTFLIHNNHLKSHLYLEELVKDQKVKTAPAYSHLHQLGDVGHMMALDLKLIFRNKRPKSLVILSGVFLLYGFIFYPQYIESNSYSALFLFALLITGLFISNYGQFLFAWQSGHFDGLMTYNTNMSQYIKAKFTLFLTVCTLQLLIASFYGFMSWRIIPIQLAAYLYSVGVNSFVTIYAATFNYKHLDLSKSASMNFQGIGALQWLQSLAISLGPALLFYLLNTFIGFWTAILGVSALGIAGLVFYKQLIHWLAGQFQLRKHKILEGFREK